MKSLTQPRNLMYILGKAAGPNLASTGLRSLCVVLIGLVAAASRALAEGSMTPPAGVTWTGERGITETMEQIAALDRSLHDHAPHSKPAMVPKPLAAAHYMSGQGSGSEDKHELIISLNAQTVSSINFTAATTPDCSGFPPDTMGGAGPSQFIIALNGRIRSFNKITGVIDNAINVKTDTFFSSVMTPPLLSNFSSDPRIRYDRLSGRWFVSMIDVPGGNTTQPNRVMLAVSSSGIINSNTTWTLFQFRNDLVGPTNNVDAGQFADYPTLAIDANALYLGVNMFSTSGAGYLNTTLFVVQKSSMLSGGPIVVTAFRGLVSGGTGIFTAHGADNYDPSATEGYVVGIDRSDRTILHLLRISTPGATPAISEYLSFPISSYAPAILVPHLGNSGGTNGYLDCVDQRLMAAHYRNGLLWTCHNVGVDNTGSSTNVASRDGVQWFAITNIPSGSSPAVSQSGIVFQSGTNNTTSARSYWMGTIMVSGQGHAAMGFSSAASGEFINAATCGRFASDPLGTMQAPVLYTRSVTVYNPSGDPGSFRGRRWGDFSFTSVDPSDDMTMWTIQEFCSGTGVYGVRAVKLLAPPPPLPTNCAPATLSQGVSNVTVTITGAASTNGAGFFDPGAGFSNRLALAISGSGVTINNLTVIDPLTLSATLSVASNAQAGPRIITATNPDGQSVAGTNGLLTILPGAVNNPPVLAFIPDHTLTVGTTLIFTNTATDPDSPPESLAFSLGSGDPTNAALDSVTGIFSWTPDATQVGANSLNVVVTDNGAPPLSATQYFTEYVVLTNHPPVVAPVPNQEVAVGMTLIFTNSATDPDSPPSTLSFSLAAGAPFHSTINPTNGVFSWAPTVSQEGTNVFGVVASDNGLPPLSGTQMVQVVVFPSNTPPALTAIANRTIHLGVTLVISNTATDPDVPPETLTYSLTQGASTGATLDSGSGLFAWTPTLAYLNTTNPFTVQVTDNGLPPLSDSKSFAVTVVPPPFILSEAISNALITITWSAISGQVYRAQSKSNIDDANWNDLTPDVTASGTNAAIIDSSPVEFQRFYRVRVLP